MTDQTLDQMTDGLTDPEPAETETAYSEPTPPAPDMTAIHAATESHAAAVETAHANLRTRMESAYAEFANALDSAYRVWENAVADAKRVEQLFPAAGGSENVHTDPTTAR
jgi:hypothetical protein